MAKQVRHGLDIHTGRESFEVATGQLVVILCTERSGSTLLTMMLGGHRRILAPPELHLFRYPDFEGWRRGFPKAIASFTWLMEQMRQPASEPDLLTRFQGRDVLSIYRELLELSGPGAFLIDKTPAYARDRQALNCIERLQPLYLWLVRHPLGYSASRMSRRDYSFVLRQSQTKNLMRKIRLGWSRARNRLRDLTGANLKKHLEVWSDTHAQIESFLETIPQDRWRRLHYEKLVTAPEMEIERLCTWLGIQPQGDMLNPSKNAPAALAWDLGDEQVLRRDRIDAAIAERWRKHFDESALDQRTRGIFERLQKPMDIDLVQASTGSVDR